MKAAPSIETGRIHPTLLVLTAPTGLSDGDREGLRMSLTLRPGTTSDEDIDLLVALNAAVQELHLAHEPETFRPPRADEVADWFRRVLADDGGWEALVAFADVTPVGYLLLEISDRPETAFTHPARLLYVHQVGVAPSARRQGVARALFERARQRGAEAGATQMGLDTWSFNEGAIAFFESCGFEVYNLRLRRDIEPALDG